jgi:hypothetical protein
VRIKTRTATSPSEGNPSARRRQRRPGFPAHHDHPSPPVSPALDDLYHARAVHDLRRTRPSDDAQPHPGTPQLAGSRGVRSPPIPGADRPLAWSSPRHVRGDRPALVFQGPHRSRLAPSEATEMRRICEPMTSDGGDVTQQTRSSAATGRALREGWLRP